MQKTVIRLQCGGETHAVVFKKDGPVCLMDHSLYTEKVAHALGGQLPTCIRLLLLYQQGLECIKYYSTPGYVPIHNDFSQWVRVLPRYLYLNKDALPTLYTICLDAATKRVARWRAKQANKQRAANA
jgi:hypothetical protein